MSKNKIIQNGGNISTGILSLGDNVSIKANGVKVNLSTNDSTELLKLIDHLILKINLNDQQVKYKEQVFKSAQKIKTEVAKGKSDPSLLQKAGKQILNSLKYAKDLIPIGHEIYDKIQSLM